MEKEKNRKFNIVFVCTGNTCRSPMAEFMFKQYLKDIKRGGEFSVSSAGLYAERGSVLSENAHKALEFLGVKHNAERKAKVFTVQMSLDADLIIGMSARHAAECDGDNVTSFESFGSKRAISDPYGGSLQVYLECAAEIRACFDDILKKCDEIKSIKNPTD